ncbi:MAG TPA: hypothetical protein VHE81_01255 [Lacipirellulaceae bacterium]|nr:hypothetical protein [Lacipirellulaceae bacterium]
MATRHSNRGGAVAATTSSSGEDEVTIDRRRASDRRTDNRESAESTTAPKLERRKKVNRRRQIDPTTCERDYTEQEVEFMNALDEYKRKSGRMFPTCSEVLEVIHSLGYVKLSPSQLTVIQAENPCGTSAKPMPQDLQISASNI